MGRSRASSRAAPERRLTGREPAARLACVAGAAGGRGTEPARKSQANAEPLADVRSAGYINRGDSACPTGGPPTGGWLPADGRPAAQRRPTRQPGRLGVTAASAPASAEATATGSVKTTCARHRVVRMTASPDPPKPGHGRSAQPRLRSPRTSPPRRSVAALAPPAVSRVPHLAEMTMSHADCVAIEP